MNQRDMFSAPLLTDLYELTMAYGYWKAGVQDQHGAFNLVFRDAPFNGGFTVACGLEQVLELLQGFQFKPDDLAYLATVPGNDGKPIFEDGFLHFLSRMRLECDMDAIAEGTLVFPEEPLVCVRGPIIQAQLIETALLNLINFPTLVATKAARVCIAARGEPVLEFGLRRAQGMDGGLSASRAAYIGGCSGTSNVLAGRRFGIPVKGTHAHSWVMLFEDEREAFRAYARAMPNNCILLVDTYNTLAGVRHAVEVGRELERHGHKLLGVRLDSGDLTYLSKEARRMLDENGFEATKILASGDLDENIINSLKQQGAAITLWGVGTRLATAYDQPALSGVYKLTAVRKPGGSWRPRIKISDQLAKISTPGLQRVRRFRRDGEYVADMIYEETEPVPEAPTIVDPTDLTRRKHIPSGTAGEELLEPIMRGGEMVYESPPIDRIRQRVQEQLGLFNDAIKRLINPHQYPVGLEQGLHERKTEMILREKERLEQGRG